MYFQRATTEPFQLLNDMLKCEAYRILILHLPKYVKHILEMNLDLKVN